MLSENGISGETLQLFLQEFRLQKGRIHEIMNKGHLHFEIIHFSEEDFAGGSKEIYLDGPAMSLKCTFTYDQYLRYLDKVREYKEAHSNFAYRMSSVRSLPNLQIIFHRGYWAMITRRNQPSVIFIILYPRLRMGIEDLAYCNYFTDDTVNQK